MKHINWEQVQELAEDALNASCVVIQDQLGIADGMGASIVFSDDKVLNKYISYIIDEIEDSESVSWISITDTKVDNVEDFKALRKAFESSMAKISNTRGYFAVINGILFCCPSDDRGLPLIEDLKKSFELEDFELDAVSKHFEMSFDKNLLF